MRTLIQQNKPVEIDELDLAGMLRKHVEERKTMDGLTVHLEILGNHSLAEAIKSGLFRIAQEALNNIIKHARVKEAWLTLDLSGNPLQLCIQDHGAGFDPADNSGNPEHLGLEGMQERVKSLGGKIKITSASLRLARRARRVEDEHRVLEDRRKCSVRRRRRAG